LELLNISYREVKWGGVRGSSGEEMEKEIYGKWKFIGLNLEKPICFRVQFV
jgi:hypothetical protein